MAKLKAVDLDTTPVILTFNEWFEILNKKYFKGSLPKAAILISNIKRNSYGYCSTTKRIMMHGRPTYEITLAVNYLKEGKHTFVDTLLHEMVHMYQNINKIKGTATNGNHLIPFKVACEERDMIVTKKGSSWGITKPTQKLKDWVDTKWEEHHTLDCFLDIDLEALKIRETTTREPKPRFNWVCPDKFCDTGLTTTAELDAITCGCGEHMINKNKEEGE